MNITLRLFNAARDKFDTLTDLASSTKMSIDRLREIENGADYSVSEYERICSAVGICPVALYEGRIEEIEQEHVTLTIRPRYLKGDLLFWTCSGDQRWGCGDTPEEALAAWRRDCENRPWPRNEDCSGCPEHRDGPHKMSCTRRHV